MPLEPQAARDIRLPPTPTQGAIRCRTTIITATTITTMVPLFGNGLGILKDRVFRIGHLGDFNDLMLMGTLCGVEMGLERAGVTHKSGGAQAALDHLAGRTKSAASQAA